MRKGFLLGVALATSLLLPGDANAAAIPPVAIGEVITYQIDFGLADGVTAAANLRDVLQAGLTFIPGGPSVRVKSTSPLWLRASSW